MSEATPHGHTNGQATTFQLQAEKLASLGFPFVPLPCGEKRPFGGRFDGWNTHEWAPGDLLPDDGLGIQTGGNAAQEIGGIVHFHCPVDCDTDESALAWAAGGPPTGMVSRRADDRPPDHFHYLVHSIPFERFADRGTAFDALVRAGRHPGPKGRSFNRKSDRQRLIDFLGTGKQIVSPPSFGRRWCGGLEPAQIRYDDLMGAIQRVLTPLGWVEDPPHIAHAVKRMSEAVEGRLKASVSLDSFGRAVEGHGGHNQLFAAARYLVNDCDLSREEALPLLLDYNDEKCIPPFTYADVLHKLDDAIAKGDDPKYPRGCAYEEKKERRQSRRREYVFTATKGRDFMKLKFDEEYAIKNMFVMRQPGIIGGPQKSLKTSVAMDLTISLASKTPFLGQFEVYKTRRTLLISGETAGGDLQSMVSRMCRKRGVEVPEDLYISTDLPWLSVVEDLEALERGLKNEGIEVVLFDTAYQCLLAGNSKAKAENMFDMGPVLKEFGDTCLAAGATPILLCHSRKSLPTKMGPMDLEHIAYAGIPQWTRQWILLNPRQRFDPETGSHQLHLTTGGSAGHYGYWHMDAVEGKDHDRWDVTVTKLSKVIAEKEKKKGKELDEAMTAVAAVLAAKGGEASVSSLVTEFSEDGVFKKITRSRVEAAVKSLIEVGRAVECEVIAYSARGSKPARGVKLVDVAE